MEKTERRMTANTPRISSSGPIAMPIDSEDKEILVGLPIEHITADAQRTRGLLFLGLAVAGAQVTMAIQIGLNANFLAGEIGVSGFQLGILEATRESCGVIAFAVLAILTGIAEPFIGTAMLMLLAVGLGCYYFAQNYLWVLLLSLVWSQGLHVWMPLPNSMTLALAEPRRAGHRLGQIQAIGAAGFGGGLIVALALSFVGVPMRPMYLLAGAMATLAAASCLGIPQQIKARGPRLVFRRRYGLYYVLSLLEGWRRQISMSFAGFLLVKQYNTPLEVILLLMAGVQAIGYFVSPRVGRLIDRIGERRILLFYYSCLTAFFVGYALIPIRLVLYVLFVIDNAFFVFAIALTTYVNRIAPKSEHTPTLSMGVAMNHVAAVAMPFIGGVLWKVSGYPWVFLIGAVAAAVSILAALRVPRHTAAGFSIPH